jgi:hypothetical protein
MNSEQAKQSCGQVQALLSAYLDNEVTPSERVLILAHLSGCTVCQQELNLLSTARSQVCATLQRRAIQAVPPRDAWSRLEARLMEDAQPSSNFVTWFSRKAPGADRAFNHFLGGVTMQKRSILSVLAGVLVLAALAVFVARNAIPVSARQILDRAYRAQTQVAPTQGIEHVRNEIFSNLEGRSDGQGMDTIIESYSDPASGNFRVVLTDKQTGKLVQVFAFDGSNAYTMEDVKGSQTSLTVYRIPQNRPSLLGTTFSDRINGKSNAALDAQAKSMFESMRRDSHVKLLGQETWENGQTVYVLRSQQEVKSFLEAENEVAHPTGLVTLYFDAETYQLLGSRATVEKDGKEIVISRQQILLDETLPADSHVAWDMSDLPGVNIVDDTNGEHKLPVAISLKDLAAKTKSAYLLKTTPKGFSLEISELPVHPATEPFFYEAGYTNQAGDYFIIRTFSDKPLEDTSWADETYTTASGLVLYFVNQPSITTRGEEFNGGLMQDPNGKTYAIDSTLSRDAIKAFLEDLVLVK